MKRATGSYRDNVGAPINFNPRPREEGDVSRSIPMNSLGISIHALVKRATKTDKSRDTPYNISIHALVKRATKRGDYFVGYWSYFNPRPREEGDWRGEVWFGLAGLISIHALVKRATKDLESRISRLEISIHALVKRATIDVFNWWVGIDISIHALVKRATA